MPSAEGAPSTTGDSSRGETRALFASSDGARVRLGDYEILGKIATGGMATVYRARKLATFGVAREFAIKTIHPHLADVPGFADRFMDEARLASKVRHPNVCAVIDAGEARGLRFLVLELVEGVTLRQLQLVGDGERLPPDEAARVITDVARGLDAVHDLADDEGRSLDVIHRDISPHNVMLDVNGRAVLIDLGLADAREKLGHTTTGVLCGKLPYMSPEQTLLDPLDRRSDVFSLGSVLFELVTGELPFGDDTRPDTLDRIRRADAEALRARLQAAKAPPWLVDVLITCLSAKREARYATAGALADALEAAMHMRGLDAADARARLAAKAVVTRERVGPMGPVDIAETPLHGGLPTLALSPVPNRRIRGVVAVAAVVLVGLGLTVLASTMLGENRWMRMEARPDASGRSSDTPAALVDTRSDDDTRTPSAVVERERAASRGPAPGAPPSAAAEGTNGASETGDTSGAGNAATPTLAPSPQLGDEAVADGTGTASDASAAAASTTTPSSDPRRPKRKARTGTTKSETTSPRLRDNPYE